MYGSSKMAVLARVLCYMLGHSSGLADGHILAEHYSNALLSRVVPVHVPSVRPVLFLVGVLFQQTHMLGSVSPRIHSSDTEAPGSKILLALAPSFQISHLFVSGLVEEAGCKYQVDCLVEVEQGYWDLELESALSSPLAALVDHNFVGCQTFANLVSQNNAPEEIPLSLLYDHGGRKIFAVDVQE
jgi:hypothetical protein